MVAAAIVVVFFSVYLGIAVFMNLNNISEMDRASDSWNLVWTITTVHNIVGVSASNPFLLGFVVFWFAVTIGKKILRKTFPDCNQ